jgi:PKD repeat protein
LRRGRFWFLIALTLILAGGGAAAGTVLSGYLGGDISVDVSPPVQFEEPWVECVSPDQDVFVSLDYYKEAFRVIIEVEPGGCFLVHLPVINKATVDTKTLLTLEYPYGATLWVTGSGVINDVVAASYEHWKFTADALAQGSAASPYDGIRIQVCVSPDYTGSSVEISGTVENTAGMDGPFVIFSGQLSEEILYLHNSPSPPTGDREAQANLPMNMYPPSAATLYNYDTDLDIDLGRLLLPTEVATDLSMYQNWQMALSQDLHLEGNVTAILWSGTQYFDRTAPGSVIAYLRDLSEAGYADIGYGILTLDPWQPDEADWVERKVVIENVDYTIPAGHVLDLIVVVPEGSSAMWLAYDTIRYPSRLVLNSYPTADYTAEFIGADEEMVTIAFTDQSTSDEGIISWQWGFGDGHVSDEQNPVHTYEEPGAYNVTLIVTEADDDSDTEVKTALVTTGGVALVDTGPTANFIATPTSGFAPMTVVFTDQSTSDDGIVLWSWDFGDGQISGMKDPIVVYDEAGLYTVTLTVSELDGDSNTKVRTGYINVSGNTGPTAAFSATPTSGYAPLTVDFTDESTTNDTIVAWLWDFGDDTTSTEQHPTHVYASEGAYTVTLTVTEDDEDVDSETKPNYINVLPEGVPFADFSGTPTSGSEPLTVSFTDQSMSSEGIVAWLWDFGDDTTSTEQHPAHIYNNEGTYTVSLMVTEADSDSDTEVKTDYITVADTGPTANFTGAPTSGYVPLTVDFTDQSSSDDGIVSWLWDFGDDTTSTEQHPTHTYTSFGDYTVSLTVTEADSDDDTETKTDYISVAPITTYAVAYQGAYDDGFVRTMNIDNDGQIGAAVIDTLEFDSSDGRTPDIIHVSGNIYAIAYQRGGLGYLRTVEIVIDGDIRSSTIDTLVFDGTQGLVPDIIHVSGDIYAIAYQGIDSDGYLRTVSIAENGQIAGSVIDTLEFDGNDGLMPDIIHVSGDIYAIAYNRDGYYTDPGYVRTVEIAANGQITDSYIDSFNFDGGVAWEADIVHVSGDIFAVAYHGYNDDGFLVTISITPEGQISDSTIDYTEFDGSDGRMPNVIAVTDTIYAIAYQRNSLGYLRTVEIAANGQITDGIIDTLIFDGTQGLVPSITHIYGDVYAIAYQGVDNDGWVRTMTIADDGQIGNNTIDSLEFDGFNGMYPCLIRLMASPNQPPVAVDDSAEVAENGNVVIDVLANDSDPDGYTLRVTNLTQPSWGSVVLNPDGTVTYTPYEGYTGPDSFTYTANDGLVDSNVATVSITVTP